MHHFQSMDGAYSFALNPYYEEGLTRYLTDPLADELWRYEDMYSMQTMTPLSLTGLLLHIAMTPLSLIGLPPQIAVTPPSLIGLLPQIAVTPLSLAGLLLQIAMTLLSLTE